MIRFLLLACLLTCSLGAETLEKRPRLDGKTFGGTGVYIENFPYQVSVLNGNTHRCSGSIINPVWVVTAGQCFDGLTAANVRFRSGSSEITNGGTLHDATQLILHPNYDYFMLEYDIGIALVTVPFVSGFSVQPIKMTSMEPTSGVPAVVTAWGPRSGGSWPYENLLQAFPVEITDRNTCMNNYGTFGGLTENMICAEGNGSGSKACVTDTGAPLVVGNLLVGLLSWGVDCGDSYYPAVYTNVATLKSFVTSITGVV